MPIEEMILPPATLRAPGWTPYADPGGLTGRPARDYGSEAVRQPSSAAGRSARCMPDRTVNHGNSRSLTDERAPRALRKRWSAPPHPEPNGHVFDVRLTVREGHLALVTACTPPHRRWPPRRPTGAGRCFPAATPTRAPHPAARPAGRRGRGPRTRRSSAAAA